MLFGLCSEVLLLRKFPESKRLQAIWWFFALSAKKNTTAKFRMTEKQKAFSLELFVVWGKFQAQFNAAARNTFTAKQLQ